jgi:hypothetical protein
MMTFGNDDGSIEVGVPMVNSACDAGIVGTPVADHGKGPSANQHIRTVAGLHALRARWRIESLRVSYRLNHLAPSRQTHWLCYR